MTCKCGHEMNVHERPSLFHCDECCRRKPVGECLHEFEEVADAA